MNQLSYTYDPAHPVMTLGGNNLNLEAGPRDQRPVDGRPDVLGFVSQPLSEPLRMEGYGRGLLYVSSDQPDTDFTLKLIDVYPDGREILVVDGLQRARFRYGYLPGQISWLHPGVIDTLSISLPPTALVFSTGHRIKIALSSSNYPRFELNRNNDLDPNDRSQARIAVNTIHFGGTWRSRIELPVVRSASGVAQTTERLQTFTLLPAFPNPFNSSVRLDYRLTHPARVQAAVYTMTGEKVCTLVQARQNGGEHWLGWSGENERAVSMPSGVYLIRLQVDDQVRTQKVTLVR
ncbi:CocE/NonD family hydrolase [bacterium]|nr:CocE/NonD family hydrolase [bacterium]